MIELTPLARPYAKALFASANEANNIEEMAEGLVKASQRGCGGPAR